ncbi:chloride channel protein, partial [Pyxidicoccus sp. 3LG]
MERPEAVQVEEGLGPGAREKLPVAPSMGPTLAGVRAPRAVEPVDRRVVFISALAVVLALAAGLVAQGLGALIHLFTNLAFFGRFSVAPVSPVDHALGPWVIVVPVVGALIVGLMARYGSRAIRGHGIPEAMEQVLYNQSRIPPRMTFLKPLSAAVAIGTGGPFGAEGPIIATGGALGSLLGQLLHVTADERKALLAAG